MGSPAFLFAWWLATASAAVPGPDGDPSARVADLGLTEVVDVAAGPGRLGTGTPSAATPVDVVTGDALRAGGARSMPEALARLPGVQAVDQTGNGRQLSIDLRGFSGAEGMTTLLVDGVRMNDADTNAAAWELLRSEEAEQVEIAQGPRGAYVGGGSIAGAVSVRRRRPSAETQADVRARGGRFGLRDASGLVSGPLGSWRLLASGGGFADEGFRDDAGSRETSWRVAADRDLGALALELDASGADGRWRQPGALDAAELASDASASAWNALDFEATRRHVLTAQLHRADGRTRFGSVVAFRDESSEILSTGRSCYGWRTRDDQRSLSAAAEADTELWRRDASRFALRWGGEASRDRLSPRGWATDDACDGEVHAEELSSATELDWDGGALFAGLDASLPRGWRAEASARHDRSRVARTGHEMSATGTWDAVSGSRSFAATTWRLAGARVHELGSATLTWRVAWAESFLAPSAVQLFAYPGFFSNPDLKPQRGSGPAAGLDVQGRAWGVRLDLFETRVEDEIAYDEAALRNVNAGTTRRRGADLRASWRPGERVRVSLGHALTDARYRGGFPEGTRVPKDARVPLVPRHVTYVDVEAGPLRGWSGLLSVRVTGSAPLSGDFDGSSPPLPGRRLVSLSVRKELPPRGLALEIAGENLLDDDHPGRGIESWTGPFYTPPVPRTVTLGLAWRFR